MNIIDQTVADVMKYCNDKVMGLSEGELRAVLEEVIADLGSQLDCIEEELGENE